MITSLLAVHVWCCGQVQVIEQRFVVAKSGEADFRTIQEAVNAVRDHSQIPAVIYVKAGVYPEKLVVPAWKKNIHIIGEDRDKVVITHADYSGKDWSFPDFVGSTEYNTYTSYTVLVQASDCMLEELTIENAAGPVGQAVALHVEADRCTVVNCSIMGHQDTLYLAKDGRNYFKDCLIEGTTDFIFGEATAVFESCTIKSLRNSYITAASTTKAQVYGFVFLRCELVAAEGVDKVYLGRPWRPFAKTVFIDTEMGSHILPEGWAPWEGDAFFPEKKRTVFYAEYGSYGPGAVTEKRVDWSKQLRKHEAKKYTLRQIFGNWSPRALNADI